MAKAESARFTAEVEGSFVVFLIGMRVNNYLAVRDWVPTFLAMLPMLRELYKSPEKGFLGGEYFVSLRGPVIIQYWRSFDDLERFARDTEDPHLPAWRRFNRELGKSGNVGVWHETYRIDEGDHEQVYSSMPPFGLARATKRVRVGRHTQSAKERLSRTSSAE